MKICAILPAAGQSKRFGAGGKSKLEVELNGRPVLLRSVQLFTNRPQVAQVIVAVDPDRIDAFRLRWADQLSFHGVKIVAGGKVERWETVRNALREVDDSCTHVAVHDAARPMASRKLIDRVLAAAESCSAVIPAMPVSATLKRVAPLDNVKVESDDPLDAILGSAGKPQTPTQRVVDTVDRADIVEVQTPQVFELALLRRAYDRIEQGKVDPSRITDDAGLVEALGETVMVVDGEPTNLKITRAEDMQLAEAIVSITEQKDQQQMARKRLFADDDD